MFLRKIYIAKLIIFCSISISLEAMHFVRTLTFARWPIFAYAQQKFVNSYFESKKRYLYEKNITAFNNRFFLYKYIPKLFISRFWSPKASPSSITQSYSANHVLGTSTNLVDEQDLQSVLLINKLMNVQDTTSFKEIGENFLQLKELNKKYPELTQLMEKHVESPNTTTFVEDLKKLAEQKELPEKFGRAFAAHSEKIKTMGNWDYYTYFLPAIYKKF